MRHSLSQHDPFPELQLGPYLVTSSDHVHLLGATIMSDLNLDRYVSVVKCILFLLASITSAYSAFAGPGVSSDTYIHVCYIMS